MGMKKTKNQPKKYTDQIEALRDIPQTAVDSVAGLGSSLWEQILGTNDQREKQSVGELKEGEELDLATLKQEGEEAKRQENVRVEPGIDYRREVIQVEKKSLQEERKEIEVKIQEIIIELKRLVATSKELQIEFKEVVQEQRIEKVGKYHLNFFQMMFSIINSARLRIENASTWLAAMQSKKKQRGYWQMFKKHGTSFGLSNERVVATQTG